MALNQTQWDTIERRTGVPQYVMQALLNRGEMSAQSSVSPAGARGRAQLMPSTAAYEGRKYGVNTSTEFGNVLAGAGYLAEQKARFGSWKLAFAAYNAGPGAVAKYGGVPPYAETQAYVRRTMAGLAGGTDGGVGTSPSPGAPQPLAPGPLRGAPDFAKVARQQIATEAQGGSYDPTTAFAQSVQTKLNPVRMGGLDPQGNQVPVLKQGGSKMTHLDQKAVRLVQSAMGTPYVWGGESRSGFDCSGLLQWAWGRAGVSIPRTTYDQWTAGTAVGKGQLRPGDAVFFRGSDPRGNLPGHVGMYIGGGKFIEAPHTGAHVQISQLAGRTDYAGARRFG